MTQLKHFLAMIEEKNKDWIGSVDLKEMSFCPPNIRYSERMDSKGQD